MNHHYLPMTEEDRQEMLKAIGIQSVDELFTDIPETVRFKGQLKVSQALSEQELYKELKAWSGENASFDSHVSFLGAGIYDHQVPAVLPHLMSRGEFYTAYTPYQAEMSQGELQAIFEFQSYICELTGMDVANASMYDGVTAFAEAGTLAVGVTKRNQLLVSSTVHPEAMEVVRSRAAGLGLEIVTIDAKDGTTDLEDLKKKVNSDTAAVMIQSPNFLGAIEDIEMIGQMAHEEKSLFIVSCNPLSLGILEAPGKMGADLVVGDVQPFGIQASLGGPTCGYFSVTKALMRRMPGRIVGETVDREGKRGYVLTLQTREQHIRREKATSNICSNQALLALNAAIYLSIMGREGFREAAHLNIHKAHYAANRLSQIEGCQLAVEAPYFNEFVLQLPPRRTVADVNRALLAKGIIGGYDLSRYGSEWKHHMLIAVTEKRTREEIEQFANELEQILMEVV